MGTGSWVERESGRADDSRPAVSSKNWICEDKHRCDRDRSFSRAQDIFAPSSVALVGATEDLGRFAGRVLLRGVKISD
jgi:hypothetical protein